MLLKIILSAISAADYSRPSGRCGKCGHQTYMQKGSMVYDVCPWCAVMRILIPLSLPVEVIRNMFSKVEKREKEKVRLHY
ncbi:MAG: hypothetical protein J6R30_01335 [Bacteroidales bacterium]|nr:hypothetical protein [Bacteroidales bacterium]